MLLDISYAIRTVHTIDRYSYRLLHTEPSLLKRYSNSLHIEHLFICYQHYEQCQ